MSNNGDIRMNKSSVDHSTLFRWKRRSLTREREKRTRRRMRKGEGDGRWRWIKCRVKLIESSQWSGRLKLIDWLMSKYSLWLKPFQLEIWWEWSTYISTHSNPLLSLRWFPSSNLLESLQICLFQSYIHRIQSTQGFRSKTFLSRGKWIRDQRSNMTNLYHRQEDSFPSQDYLIYEKHLLD